MPTSPAPDARTRAAFHVKRIVRRGHELLGDAPFLLPLQLALTPEGVRERTVTRDTDLVIEGFPRSGNTFAALAFQQVQPAPVRVVSHVHIPAQVRKAVGLHVPTLVVFRRSDDAVVSMAVADPHHRVSALLRYWCHYHDLVLRCTAGVVFAPFEAVTTDLAGVIERVNGRFGTTFRAAAPDEEAVFAAIDEKQRRVHGADGFARGVARPNDERAAELAARRRELEAVPTELRARADELHRRLLGET